MVKARCRAGCVRLCAVCAGGIVVCCFSVPLLGVVVGRFNVLPPWSPCVRPCVGCAHFDADFEVSVGLCAGV